MIALGSSSTAERPSLTHRSPNRIVEPAGGSSVQSGGKILKSDLVLAKNYLTEEGLANLGRIVSAYLDLAESHAKRRVPMTMEDWAKRLDTFAALEKCEEDKTDE